jgi:NitT/TauT family transport system ATP-binding protein
MSEIAISVRHLVKRFAEHGRELCVLPGLSFDVLHGTFVTIVGPSGSGKSTLLNIIAGLERETSGTVEVRSTGGGTNPRLGYVFQSARLLPWLTVEDNLRFVRPADVSAAAFERGLRRHLALVGLEGVGGKYPHQLSGGMQQRVGIARALCVEPAVLLMDEPFSHLDEITAEQLRVELLRIWQDTRQTIVFVTHDMQEAVTLADRFMMLSASGELVADVPIDLPRPRAFSDRAFIEVYASLVDRFHAMRNGGRRVEAVAG